MRDAGRDAPRRGMNGTRRAGWPGHPCRRRCARRRGGRRWRERHAQRPRSRVRTRARTLAHADPFVRANDRRGVRRARLDVPAIEHGAHGRDHRRLLERRGHDLAGECTRQPFGVRLGRGRRLVPACITIEGPACAAGRTRVRCWPAQRRVRQGLGSSSGSCHALRDGDAGAWRTRVFARCRHGLADLQ